MKLARDKIYCFLFTLLISFTVKAQMELPSFFGDHMVLQQQEAISIWGKDTPGTTVKISTSWGNEAYGTANSEGFWFTSFKTEKASFNPHTIRVKGSTTKELKNILIGEVWFCSGQSNMEMSLTGIRASTVENAEKYIQIANNKNIRLFNNARTASVKPSFDVNGQWVESSKQSAERFSAIGYIFGVRLYETLNVPIGIIESSWGGTKIECWIPKQELIKYKTIKFADSLPIETNRQKQPSFLYNAMISPFKSFKIKGVLWYQGESNRFNPEPYQGYMEDLIKTWRKQWGNEKLPFYFVQIAPYNYPETKNTPAIKANIVREAQFKVSKQIENTGLVVTTDAGDCSDIHPSKKEIVANRLSSWALANQYNFKKLSHRSPEFKKFSVKNSEVKLSFSFYNNDGFIAAEHVEGFAIAGADRTFYPAQVSFSKNEKKIILYSEKVKNPVAVRYGFEDCFESNLITKSGLPISIFRTDNW